MDFFIIIKCIYKKSFVMEHNSEKCLYRFIVRMPKPSKMPFIVERNRSWSWKKKIKAFDNQIAISKSKNPAYAGKYLDDTCTYKPHNNDLDNISRLLKDLEDIKKYVNSDMDEKTSRMIRCLMQVEI